MVGKGGITFCLYVPKAIFSEQRLFLKIPSIVITASCLLCEKNPNNKKPQTRA